MVLPRCLRENFIEWIAIEFGSIDFFFEEGRQARVAINDLNNFLQLSKNENFLREADLRIFDSSG